MEQNTSQNKEIFVHIGFGKTATTTLQQNVFPKLCKFINFQYWKNNSVLAAQIKLHYIKLELGLKCDPINFPDKILISNESLCAWDPYYWEEYAEKNLIAFGKKTHIILTIREPKSYLTSIYTQLCLHELKGIQKPEYFFLTDDMYSERLPAPKFAIEKFSYNKVIDFYKHRFDKVTVIKYEHLDQLTFLIELFSITENQLKILKDKFKIKTFNRGFSIRGVNYTFKLSKFLNLFKLSLGSEINNDIINKLKFDNNKKSLNISKSNFRHGIILRLFRELNWRHFVQERLDRLLPYKKYKLNFTKLPYIDIKKLEKEYDSLSREFTILNK